MTQFRKDLMHYEIQPIGRFRLADTRPARHAFRNLCLLHSRYYCNNAAPRGAAAGCRNENVTLWQSITYLRLRTQFIP